MASKGLGFCVGEWRGVALEDFILLVLFIYLFVGSGFMEGVCASFQNPRHWISFVVLAADSFVCHEF